MSKRKPEWSHGTAEPPTKKYRPESLPPLPSIPPEYEAYVFTHPSAGSKVDKFPMNYDRLEFLGDAHLQIIATVLIYDSYPTANAGRMSQIRQQLVQNETLCQYSQMYAFDKRLKINMNDQFKKMPLTKIYGDVFEAYVGAIFKSDPINGPARAETWLRALWAPKWEELLTKFPPEITGQKEALAKKIVVPGVKLDYVEEKKAVVHKGKGVETYFIGVYMTGWGFTNQHLGSAKASSKVQAGQEAAMAALANKRWMDTLTEKKERYMEEKNAQRQNQDHDKPKEVGVA